MRFSVISAMGEALEQALLHGVVGRSFANELNTLQVINPREFTTDVHQTIDDRPFGGGDGMLMMAEPLGRCIDALRGQHKDLGPLYMLSPQGALWTDSDAVSAGSAAEPMALICGRYGGVDQRFLSEYDVREISIGNYVLSGGELAAAVVIDSVARKIPGVLGHKLSAQEDSFGGEDDLLEAPQFTRPREWRGREVPGIFLQGHHQKIQNFQDALRWLVTLQKRPDLLRRQPPLEINLREVLKNLSEADKKNLGLEEKTLLEAMERRSW